mmetsp:Transcript_111988/g.311810  ORF Transcript_111988/g.311810 Transcript_111988/m.311810 type:complete len:218 (-) Transcript_111988:570-1223(-)
MHMAGSTKMGDGPMGCHEVLVQNLLRLDSFLIDPSFVAGDPEPVPHTGHEVDARSQDGGHLEHSCAQHDALGRCQEEVVREIFELRKAQQTQHPKQAQRPNNREGRRLSRCCCQPLWRHDQKVKKQPALCVCERHHPRRHDQIAVAVHTRQERCRDVRSPVASPCPEDSVHEGCLLELEKDIQRHHHDVVHKEHKAEQDPDCAAPRIGVNHELLNHP